MDDPTSMQERRSASELSEDPPDEYLAVPPARALRIRTPARARAPDQGQPLLILDILKQLATVHLLQGEAVMRPRLKVVDEADNLRVGQAREDADFAEE